MNENTGIKKSPQKGMSIIQGFFSDKEHNFEVFFDLYYGISWRKLSSIQSCKEQPFDDPKVVRSKPP